MPESAASSAQSNQLQATLSNMALALNCVEEAVVWTDVRGHIQWCNAAFEQLVSHTAEALAEQPLLQVLPLTLNDEWLPALLHPVSCGLASQQQQNGQYGFSQHNRSFRLALTVMPLSGLDGDNASTGQGVMVVIRDITTQTLQPRSPQRANLELEAAVSADTEALSHPDQRLINVLESITDAFFTLDEAWCFTYLNHQAEQLLQRSRADLLGKNVWTSFPEAVNSLSDSAYHRAVDEQCSVASETFYPPLNTWFEVRAYPITNGLAVYFQNISERKCMEIERQHTEAALRKSEQRFRSIFDTTAIGTATTSLSSAYLQVNAAYCQILGYTEAELLTQTFQQITHPEDVLLELPYTEKLLAGEISSCSLEKRYFHKDGHLVWGLLSLLLVRDEQQPLYYVAQIKDITDRKHTEAALRESEARLRLALEAAQMSTWDWDIQNDTVTYAGGLRSGSNAPPGNHRSAYPSFLRDVHPDDRAYVELSLAHALEGAAYNIEFRANWADGVQHWIESKGQVYFDQQGHPTQMLGVVREITKRKQAEFALHQLNQELEQRIQSRTIQLEAANQQLQAAIAGHKQTEAALLKSEEQFRTFFDNAPIAISLADAHTYQIVRVNQAHHDLLGYSNAELATMTYVGITHPDDIDQNLDLVKQLLDGSISHFQIEKRFMKKNRDWIWANLTVTLVRDSDGRTYSMGTIENITDRKHAEAALLESQQFLRLVMDSLPNKIFWKDKKLRYLGCNRQHALDAGIAPEDIVGKTDFELPWAAHAEGYHAVDQAVITSEQSRLNIEESFTNVEEERFWVNTSKVPLRDLNGTVVGVLGICVDITERKRTQESLQLTQFSVDCAADPIWWVKPDGSIYYVNDAACRDLGYTREAIVGKRVSDFNPDSPIEDWAEHWKFIKEMGSFTFEARLRASDGTFFPIEVSANHIELNNKEYHCSFVRNITDRKQAEEKLRNSLAEKEVLLKEVHHRVKNNLQTISSLLNLQANTIHDPKILAPFKDSQHRVKAMALIHEKLYQSESLAKVNFSDYVHSLVTNLVHSYSKNPANIHLKLELAKLELPVDAAIPCGFIINELVTNSLKYAFPDDRTGEIQISFSLSTTNQCLLVIADDGVGFLKPLALLGDVPTAHSLGLQLVNAFVHQLRGTVGLKSQGGSRFEIVFPKPT